MAPDIDLFVLGAGAAGLSAAFYARRAGLVPHVFEAASSVGGNARTIAHGDFLFDTGAHRFHDRYPEITGDVRALVGSELAEVRAPSRIHWRGTSLPFPLAPIATLTALGPRLSARAGLDLVAGRVRRRIDDPTFEDVAVRRYGRTLADLFLLGYSEKLWGIACRDLAPRVAGGRLGGLSLRMLARELWRRDDAPVSHLDGRFLYPARGIGVIADRLADACGPGSVATASRVTRIAHRAGSIVALEINGTEVVDVGRAMVACTLPQPLALRLLDPAPPGNVCAAAAELRFRHVVLVTLLVHRPSVSDCATIYFPEPQYAFTRLSEPRNRSALMAPPGKTSLSLEIPCWTSDAAWIAGDDELIARAVADLGRAGLVDPPEILGATVHRLPFAYPVIERTTPARLDALAAYLRRFDNLRLVGRVGAFDYVHLHDLLRAGKGLAGDAVRWRESSSARGATMLAV